MHTSTILKEAINYLTKKDKFELSIVLLAISVERLMKQHLYEIDDVLVLDKNNTIEHLVKFKRLQSKLSNKSNKDKFLALKEKRESFKTITFDELIKRYNAFFDIDKDRANALRRLGNLRNDIVHYFQYFINEVDEGLFILNEIIPFTREITQEISDSSKYDNLFDEKVVQKLQRYEKRLTRLQQSEFHQKIAAKKEEYGEMNEYDIESKREQNIRDFYDERVILKESMQCVACENSAFNVLKLFDETEEEENPEFIIIGKCIVCELELSEDELKSLGLIEGR